MGYGETKPKKTESFFANHVKLMTFLIVIAVFLLIAGPLFYLSATKWFSPKDTRPEMTQRDVVLLANLQKESGEIFLDKITRFACEEKTEANYIKVTVRIKPNYTMTVLASKDTRLITECTLVHNKRNEKRDVFQDDIKEYFAYVNQFE